jgi:hypothetical protein
MSWFFIALWAPFLLAFANHNDKFLLSRYLKEKHIGSIVILCAVERRGDPDRILHSA